VEIHSPARGAVVAGTGVVEGSAEPPADAHLWILVRRKDLEDGWWPQGGGAVPTESGRWKVSVRYGEPHDAGHDFEIAAVVVGSPTHQMWSGLAPPVRLPAPAFVRGEAYRTVRKAR